MSIDSICLIAMNPHYIGKLIQAFLTGYGDACDIKLVLMAMPILFHKPSRERLMKAKSGSRLKTIYGNAKALPSGETISGQAQIAGFLERYYIMLPHVKRAIICATSDKLIYCDEELKLSVCDRLEYKSMKKPLYYWYRASYYLGNIFRIATPEEISYILEVNQCH